ncbi:plasmid replication protein [Escherichia coli]|jgi:predicted DNA-binding transcriptional regulator YafY|nr:plasmid replication protein [Escherichia coli]EIC3708970.1 plasmid replication protein [Salmonella enterica subsp. enterica serovar Bovismorbificans]EKN6537693.1 plasmid replication protein [Salmonella enterica]HCB3654497.1 plasmid replication protein [Klebsiella pneumoniae]ELC5525068.1 plasmid replication protein [Salmonella enterica]
MAAHIQKKRTLKAREVALLEGISERTVRKYIAQPREDYEKEAQEKRSLAFHLRSSGLKWREVAEKMNTTENAAIAYYRRYLALDLKTH